MHDVTDEFFARYARALLARDADAVAAMYAVPALIAFPGRSIAVGDRQQTRDFFASTWPSYEGVTEAEPQVQVLAATDHSVWADVAWSYGGAVQERFVYQLLDRPDGWQIGVLTPMGL